MASVDSVCHDLLHSFDDAVGSVDTECTSDREVSIALSLFTHRVVCQSTIKEFRP